MSRWIGGGSPACVSLMYSKRMATVTIFCDGASKGNPGPGGWGAIVSHAGRVTELGGAAAHTTNNKMELTAALEALRFARVYEDAPVVLNTDSSYVINGITAWVKGWRANGWRTKEKKEVLNRDLWEALAELADTREIEWRYVGGHIGIAGNERVDAIASAYAVGEEPGLFDGERKEYPFDIENAAHDAGLKERKSSSRSRSKAKAYSYVSLVDGVVMTHASWGECAQRVNGKTARFKKATSPQEEQDIIAEFSRR